MDVRVYHHHLRIFSRHSLVDLKAIASYDTVGAVVGT